MFQNPTGLTMEQKQLQQNINYNGQQQQQQQQHLEQKNIRKKAYVKVIEQPASKALRFRYECEGRSAGSIPGMNSTPEIKTYPTIEIVDYKGRAVVVVSCVTKDMPYRPHPHNLVGKDGCKKGVCTVEVNSKTMRAVFSNLGIQCVKRKDIEEALKMREEIQVDPFKTGFSHRSQPSSIDLNSVRLCFQVFIESEQKGRFTKPLPPVVSEPIYDKKAMSNLVICTLCSCSASVLGNTHIILLCEKVAREDIAVRFFEEKNGQQVWEAYGEFHNTDVHKQTAISFKTPRYHTLDITEPAKVYIQLRRPSDGMTSEALPFEFKPLDSDPAHLRRKRQRTGGDPVQLLFQQLQQETQQHQNKQDGTVQNNPNCWNIPNIPLIKPDPRRRQPLSPTYTHNQTSPTYNGVSPEQHQQQQYFGEPGAGNAAIPPDTTVELPNFNPFIQQNLVNHSTQQQQQQYNYNTNPFTIGGTIHWGNKQSVAAMSVANNNNNNNISIHNNPLATNNIQTTNDGSGAGVGVGMGRSNGVIGSSAETGCGTNQHWNMTTNHVHNPRTPYHNQHPHTHHQQQHQPPIKQKPEYIALAVERTCNGLINGRDHVKNTNKNGNHDNINNNHNNENGPTVSNLLSFDSDQLVHIDSEDEQMFSLNTEDLKISSLSISA